MAETNGETKQLPCFLEENANVEVNLKLTGNLKLYSVFPSSVVLPRKDQVVLLYCISKKYIGTYNIADQM
jgi:hypothetical protein